MVIRARSGGPPPRFDRIAGPDRTGTVFAVVDAVGRFVDVSLHPGWQSALGPARVAAGLLEALETARLKAALVPMILRRQGYHPSPQAEGKQPTEDEQPAGEKQPAEPKSSSKGRPPPGIAEVKANPGANPRAEAGAGATAEAGAEASAAAKNGAVVAAKAEAAAKAGARAGGRHRAEDPHEELPPPGDERFLDAARGRISEAYRLIDDAGKRLRAQQATRVISGPSGLFRLHVRGSRIERAEVVGATDADTDRLVADARAALTELARARWEP